MDSPLTISALAGPKPASGTWWARGSTIQRAPSTTNAYVCRPGASGTRTDHEPSTARCTIGVARSFQPLKSPTIATTRAEPGTRSTNRTAAPPSTRVAPSGSVSDGAAAVVLASEGAARKFRPDSKVHLAARVLHSGIYDPGPNTMTTSRVSSLSAREAYEKAGIGPGDLDVLELHDSFSIAELMYYEAFQLCEPGGAMALLRSGATSLGGRHVVNPSGGLLSRGHPVAASGVVQAAEITRQLEGRSGAHQVEGAKLGLTHVTGGGISGFEHGACAVTVFKR